MRISFKLEGVNQVINDFDTRERKARRLKIPLGRSADYMLGEIEENYQGRGSKWGKWQRRAKSYPWRILEKTGAMRRGFDSQVDSRKAVIRNKQPYFKYHQSSHPRKTSLPRRIMMAIQEQQRREIIRIFQRHIMDSKE